MKKTSAKAKKTTAKKTATKKTAAAREPSSFFASKRGDRGTDRKAFHVLLDEKERKKLIDLTFKRRMSAADVVRDLIAKAKD